MFKVYPFLTFSIISSIQYENYLPYQFFHMYESQNSLSLPEQDSEEVYWFYNYSNNLKYLINMGLVYLPLWIEKLL